MSDSLLTVRPAFGTWQGNCIRIEYGLGLLEEIRRSVQEGFHKIPHGGVETGGLLYGKWDGAVLTIAAWRPMACEHPSGPRFQLSLQDEEALAAQMAAPPQDLAELQVVGWFASHSRGALQLRGPDVDLHNKHFPEPWHTILLLCASRNQPMQAAFYCRAEGTLAPAAAVSGFDVVPNPTAVPRRARRGSGERPAGEPGRELPPALPGSVPDVPESMRVLATQVASQPVEGILAEAVRPDAARTEVAPVQAHVPAVPPVPPAEPAAHVDDASSAHEELPKFAAEPLPSSGIPWKRLAWVALWLLLAGAGVWAIPRYLAVPQPLLDVHMEQISGTPNGQMVIYWTLRPNRADASSETAEFTGELVVMDGAERRSFPVPSTQALSGALTYWRRSPDVQATLNLSSESGGSAQAMAEFHDPSGTAQPAAAQDPAIQRLREELVQARRQGRRLEREIAAEERKGAARN